MFIGLMLLLLVGLIVVIVIVVAEIVLLGVEGVSGKVVLVIEVLVWEHILLLCFWGLFLK